MKVNCFVYCNAWKEYSSMNINEIDNVFADTMFGRKKLYEVIEQAIMLKDITIEGFTLNQVQEMVLAGNIRGVNDMISGGNIFQWEVLG